VTRLAQPEARGARQSAARAAAALTRSRSPTATARHAAELHAQVRAEFEASRSARHAYAAKYALSEGRVRLRQLEEMLGMQG
jgi:hypothetical protein